MALAAANLLYLPDDCWEDIFKFLTCDDAGDDYIRVMDSLSVISKQFLTITNRLRYSFTIPKQTRHDLDKRLSNIFQRFPNLTSLNLSGHNTALRNFQGDFRFNYLLLQISQFSLKLTSLTHSNSCTIPINGLRCFSQKINSITSLTCFNIDSINSTDIFVIADCFPLLEELDISYRFPHFPSIPSIVEPLSLVLFKLRKVNLSGHCDIDGKLLFHLFKNCKLLEEANLSHCIQLTDADIASALLERPTLKSLTIHKLYDWAMLFAFTRNCPSLSEITVRHVSRVNNVENFNSFVESPQLKSLSFVWDCWLTKETIKVFALFPNLMRLDLVDCDGMSGKLMCQLLRMCCKLKHLNLSYCQELNVSKMNFEVPKLEVLNLANTSVDDKALHVISKSCCGLLQLILEDCYNVTEMGVKHVVENCTQLRVINLRNCLKVDADVAALKLHSRRSLINIVALPRNMTGFAGEGGCSWDPFDL